MTETLTVRTVPAIAEVAAEAWDACANPPALGDGAADGERFNPSSRMRFCWRWSSRVRWPGAPVGRPRMCSWKIPAAGSSRRRRLI